ncbi:MAG: GAF domain-containing protein, partial [Baekduiaceae bacterium]
MEGELIAVVAVAALAIAALGALAWALGGWRRADVHGREMLLGEREADLQAARYESALHRDRVEVLHRATDRLTGELDDERLASTILELLLDAVRAPAGTLHLIREGDVAAPAVAARGLAPGVLPTIRQGEGPAGYAWRDGRTTTGEHSREHTIEGPGGEVPAVYEVAVPLRRGDQILAVARMLSADERGYGAGQLQTAERVAALGGLALAHRELRVAALQTSRVNAAMLDATPDALALLAGDGTVIVENEPMRELRAAGVEPVASADAGADGELRDELPNPAGDGVLLRF